MVTYVCVCVCACVLRILQVVYSSKAVIRMTY